MAETPSIDNIAKTAPRNEAKKTEEKPKQTSTLESVVDESGHLAKIAVALGLSSLIPYAQATTFPSAAIDTAVLSSVQIAADATTSFKRGKKYTAVNSLESSILGTAITIPTEGFFALPNSIPPVGVGGYLAKAAVWGGLCYPAFIGLYQAADYLIKNRKFKGMGSYIKKEYWPTLKYSW